MLPKLKKTYSFITFNVMNNKTVIASNDLDFDKGYSLNFLINLSAEKLYVTSH